MIRYEDFSLKIEPSRDDVFPVIVLRSPAGEGRSQFRLPFEPGEIGDILFDLGETVRGSSGKVVREAAPGATRTRPQQIGDQLFNSLFSGPVRSLLDRSLGMLHGSKQGLRVKLHIDPEDASLALLTSLPWELMYRKETREFLNLSSFTPILRYLDVQVPCIPLPLEPPLRILVVIASPLDQAQLDLERERRQIDETWARQQDVAVDFLQPATILELQQRLATEPYHALHYMGHGGFDQRTGRGVLLLEDERGHGAAVDGSTLGVLLRDAPTLRLVFLNACETARVSKQVGLDPFAGVAAAMVMAGIPAVVAMQFPITDGAAIRFANRFYPLLAEGQPVDYAVAQGRQAILATESGTMEWATPVLFMRAPEGTLFQVSGAHLARRRLQKPPTLDEQELSQQLEERYIAGLGAFWLEEWDKAVRSFEMIAAVRPDYQDVAAKLEEARRRQKWDGLYEQAQAARVAEDWGAVIAALDELVAEKPDFEDAAALLELARRQKQLADLYAQAQRLHAAARWQAVVNVFAEIHALDPNHADPGDLLPTAQQQVAELERQAALSDLFGRALRQMDGDRWPEARELLAQVQEAEPGYQGADRLLERAEAEIARQETERQRQAELAALYAQAVNQAEAGQWAQALATMEELKALDPELADPRDIAPRARAEVERRRKLETLYAQAQAAYDAGNWSEAQAAFQAMVDEDADYRDAAALLAEVETQQELAYLYAQAQQHHDSGQWQAVIETFARMAAVEPGYADPEGLLTAAEGSLAEQQRRAELHDLYTRAEQALEAGDWAQARQLLAQIRELEPGYGESEQLLARAKAEMEQAEAERQRREQIATLYEQAQSLTRARQWRQALAKMQEILVLDAEFADPEGIAARAQQKVEQEEAEAQRQNELAALYAEAVRLLKAGQYQEALEEWVEVQTLDPRYPDRKKVQATARKKLAALAKPAAKRRPLTWALAVMVGLALVIIVAAALLLSGALGGRGTPDTTNTAVAVVAVPTATPKRTSTPRSSTPAPTRTPRPSSTQAAVAASPSATIQVQQCASGVLFCEDFRTGRADGWNLESGWKVEQDGDNYVLSGSGHYFATLEDLTRNDYRVRFRLKIEQGAIHLNYRTLVLGETWTRYFIGFSETGISLSKTASSNQHSRLDSSGALLTAGQWHEVEIRGWGGQLQVYADGRLGLAYNDPLPLRRGGISFETLDNSRAQVDDIEVISVDQPAPTPTMDADPTVYDNFDNPAYDGVYNYTLWNLWTSDPAGSVAQGDGALKVDVNAGEETTMSPPKYQGMKLEAPTFFETKVKRSGGFTVGSGSFYVVCGLSGPPEQTSAGCAWWDSSSSDPRAASTGIVVAAEGWHTLRTEIEPATMAFACYIDGQQVLSGIPSNADELRDSTFTFDIAAGNTAQLSVAYFDDVRIGPLEP